MPQNRGKGPSIVGAHVRITRNDGRETGFAIVLTCNKCNNRYVQANVAYQAAGVLILNQRNFTFYGDLKLDLNTNCWKNEGDVQAQVVQVPRRRDSYWFSDIQNRDHVFGSATWLTITRIEGNMEELIVKGQARFPTFGNPIVAECTYTNDDQDFLFLMFLCMRNRLRWSGSYMDTRG